MQWRQFNQSVQLPLHWLLLLLDDQCYQFSAKTFSPSQTTVFASKAVAPLDRKGNFKSTIFKSTLDCLLPTTTTTATIDIDGQGQRHLRSAKKRVQHSQWRQRLSRLWEERKKESKRVIDNENVTITSTKSVQQQRWVDDDGCMPSKEPAKRVNQWKWQ